MTLPDGDKKAVLGVKTRQTRNGYIVVELEHYRAASTTQRETEHQVSTAMSYLVCRLQKYPTR